MLYKYDVYDESSDVNPLNKTQAGRDEDEDAEKKAARTFDRSPIHELLIRAISACK